MTRLLIPLTLLLAPLAHPLAFYAAVDVNCLRTACTYNPPGKNYAREAGLLTAPEVPPSLEKAVLAQEDPNFNGTFGFSPTRIFLAFLLGRYFDRPVHGTSGLEQQVAKNVFVGPDRSLGRKYREAVVAFKIHRRFSKAETLRLYASLAQVGPDMYGLASGARAYFSKEDAELTDAEAVVLVAVLPNPAVYAGYFDAPLPDAGRLQLLKKMRRLNVPERTAERTINRIWKGNRR